MRYLFDNVNTAEIEKICAAGDAPETCVPCPTCGGRGVIETAGQFRLEGNETGTDSKTVYVTIGKTD